MTAENNLVTGGNPFDPSEDAPTQVSEQFRLSQIRQWIHQLLRIFNFGESFVENIKICVEGMKLRLRENDNLGLINGRDLISFLPDQALTENAIKQYLYLIKERSEINPGFREVVIIPFSLTCLLTTIDFQTSSDLDDILRPQMSSVLLPGTLTLFPVREPDTGAYYLVTYDVDSNQVSEYVVIDQGHARVRENVKKLLQYGSQLAHNDSMGSESPNWERTRIVEVSCEYKHYLIVDSAVLMLQNAEMLSRDVPPLANPSRLIRYRYTMIHEIFKQQLMIRYD